MHPPIFIAGLVPAAGSSRRMGQDKRILAYRGATVLETVVWNLRHAGLSSIVVVLEPSSICQNLPGLSETIQAINPHPEKGMLSSIRVGLAHLPSQAEAVAVLPGDHPFVPAEVMTRLFEVFCIERPLLLLPSYAGKHGHPLIIHRTLFEEACGCDDQIGLRQLISRRERDLWIVDIDMPEADDDLDVPSDLDRLRR